MRKTNPSRPPALSQIKRLKFRPSPALKKKVTEVGIRVQRELEQENKSQTRSIDSVLRAIVRSGDLR
jgi:hypothetical protein